MSFATVQKTIELIFNVFPFDAILVYRQCNSWMQTTEKEFMILVYVLWSLLPPLSVFNRLLSIVLFIIRTLLSYSPYLSSVLYFHRKETFFTLIVPFLSVFHCGKLPDEIQIRQNRATSLSNESALKSTVILLAPFKFWTRP